MAKEYDTLLGIGNSLKFRNWWLLEFSIYCLQAVIGCGLPKIAESNLREGVAVDYIKSQPQGSPLKLVGILRSEVSSSLWQKWLDLSASFGLWWKATGASRSWEGGGSLLIVPFHVFTLELKPCWSCHKGHPAVPALVCVTSAFLEDLWWKPPNHSDSSPQ